MLLQLQQKFYKQWNIVVPDKLEHNHAELAWLKLSEKLQQQKQTFIMVMVGQVQGSSPREMGARMLVTESSSYLTIGGGNLEHQAMQIARGMLSTTQHSHYQRFSLAAGLGQCCGGVVSIIFEKITPHCTWIKTFKEFASSNSDFVHVMKLNAEPDRAHLLVSEQQVIPHNAQTSSAKLIASARQHLQQENQYKIIKWTDDIPSTVMLEKIIQQQNSLYIFGAGHVGSALVGLLKDQPFSTTWVDTREHMFNSNISAPIKTECTDCPEAIIAQAAKHSYFLLMTHDHALDQRLAEHILQRNDFAYFGMIGSRTKRVRFEHRLSARGIAQSTLDKMVCPIGIAGIKSKKPAAIAVAVLAQLLQSLEVASCNATPQLKQGLDIKERMYSSE